MEVRTILWPTDLSRNSLKAARHVVSLAEKFQAKVVMLYVGVDPTSLSLSYGEPSETYLKHFQEHEIKLAKKKMEGVCDKDLKACPMLNIKLVQGEPAQEILKAVKDENADMLVITTHGRGHDEIDQLTPAFGSVAAKVIQNSPVPIHLVNPFKER